MLPRASDGDALGDGGWIDNTTIDEILLSKLHLLCAIDGSEHSMRGLEFAVEGLMQAERNSFLDVLHVFCESKTYLPLALRKESLEMHCDNLCTSYLLPSRYRVRCEPRAAHEAAAERIKEAVKGSGAHFVVMGFFGRKGVRKKEEFLCSNVMEVMQRAASSLVVIQSDERDDLPLGRPTRFVVSVSLNQAATKAFIDTLRVSKPGDEIHVVYIKSYLERTESDYTIMLRKKYANIFAGLNDESQEALSKFGGRTVLFKMVPKLLRESTALGVVRYCDEVAADFVVVGTNSLRVEKGKSHLGSVSLEIIRETTCNFIVSNWIPGAGRRGSRTTA